MTAHYVKTYCPLLYDEIERLIEENKVDQFKLIGDFYQDVYKEIGFVDYTEDDAISETLLRAEEYLKSKQK